MERVVLALGGSIVAPPGEPDPQALIQWTEAIKEWGQEVQLLVVVGGGAPARNAISLARGGSTVEEDLDRVGIAATRLNAQVMLAFLKGNGLDTNHAVPITTKKAAKEANDHSMVVMGGTEPGHSTDYVAAELAQVSGASRLVIVSNVDGVYTADPNKDTSAERLTHITHDGLLEIVGGPHWSGAGHSAIVDGPAAALLQEARMDAAVVGGRNITNVGKAVRGLDFDGTRIGATVEAV